MNRGVDVYRWVKSSRCDAGNCVEVARVADTVLVRHSSATDGPVLSFSQADWGNFLAAVRAGEFDLS